MKIISIAGASASGKTTMSKVIMDELQETKKVSIISLDDYYLSEQEQVEKNGLCNFDHPSALDKDLLLQNINELKYCGTTLMPKYSFFDHKRIGYEEISACDIIVVEGLYANMFLYEMSDVLIFTESDFDTLLSRRILRDMTERGRELADIIKQYFEFVKPAYLKHIVEQKNYSDFIVTNYTIDEIHDFVKESLDLNAI